MARLIDHDLECYTEMIMNIAELSEMCLINAIESYEKGIVYKTQIFERSEKPKYPKQE